MRVLSLLGKEINRKIGKKNTDMDLSIYFYKEGEKHLEILEPSLYPEKIQPLLFGLNLCDYIIFEGDLNNKYLGEIILAIILSGKKGFIVNKEIIEHIIKNTPLEEWPSLEKDPLKIREALIKLEEKKKEEKGRKIIIEQVFNLKSIGTVLIGNVYRGNIKVHDTITLYPLNKEIQIKSLQCHDKDVKEINENEKAGINIKGEKAENIKRGFVLGDNFEYGDEFEANVKITKFIKEIKGIPFICIGLQTAETNLEIKPGDEKKVKIKTNKNLVWERGEKFFIYNPNLKPRVFGVGEI